MINRYLEHLYISGKAPGTIKCYRLTLQDYEQYLLAVGVWEPLEANTETIKTYYLLLKKRGLASATCHKKTAIVHSFYHWLVVQGYLLLTPAPAPVPMNGDSLPRYVPSTKEIQQVHELFYNGATKTELRDSVAFDLAYSCGLRRGELAKLNVQDIDQRNGLVIIRQGKGRKDRLVPIGEKSLRNLQHYLVQVRPKLVDGRPTRALFISKQYHKRLKVEAFGSMFKRLREKHNVGKQMTLHTLRHACATDMLRAGASIQDVSRILGHARLMTTQIYTRMVIRDLKKVHAQFHPRG